METIKELLAKHHLSHLEKKIMQAAMPTVKILKKENFFIESGLSRIGGMPDVPEDFVYPMNNNQPIPFLLQINLEQLTEAEPNHFLPKSGMLYFFYDVIKQPWGLEKEDKNYYKVIYVEDEKKLYPIDFPKNYPEETIIRPTEIEFNKSLSFPLYGGIGYDEIGFLNDDDENNYYEFLYELDGDEPLHQLFGHACNIQNEVLKEIDYYYSKQENKPSGKDWNLLLQFDTDDELDIMWGDAGMIYFAIDKEDAINKRFDETRFSLQCH